MRKMISILTLCLVTGFSMASPVAASTVQSSTQTTDNVNIIQSGLSDANLCLNQNALLLNGVYINGSCMKLQPKCNSAVVNSYILQQVSKNNALCKNNVQQQNYTANPATATAAKVTAGIPAATAPSSVAATKAAANTQTTACPKTGTQTTTTTQPGTVTKQTQSTGTTTSTKPATNTDNSTSTSSFREFQKQVIALVNKERAAAGLSALTENTALDNTATLKSEDMVKLNYFSHTSPTYGSPFEMMTQFNISYSAAGENIAYGQSTPEEVMNGWMNSPGHRANILNANFTQIGVGIAQKANGQYVWTQQFIRP